MLFSSQTSSKYKNMESMLDRLYKTYKTLHPLVYHVSDLIPSLVPFRGAIAPLWILTYASSSNSKLEATLKQWVRKSTGIPCFWDFEVEKPTTGFKKTIFECWLSCVLQMLRSMNRITRRLQQFAIESSTGKDTGYSINDHYIFIFVRFRTVKSMLFVCIMHRCSDLKSTLGWTTSL